MIAYSFPAYVVMGFVVTFIARMLTRQMTVRWLRAIWVAERWQGTSRAISHLMIEIVVWPLHVFSLLGVRADAVLVDQLTDNDERNNP